MSINSAMLAGVSGLVANSSALAAISDNIANVNTVGYKRSGANFSSMVMSSKTGLYSAGGVSSKTHQFISQQGLSQATGLDSSKTSQLLAILAPIVMSYLAQRFASGGNANPGQLSHALGQEAQSANSGGLLTSVLDQDGDGQLGVGDLLKLGGGLFGKR